MQVCVLLLLLLLFLGGGCVCMGLLGGVRVCVGAFGKGGWVDRYGLLGRVGGMVGV